jgi:hypothetical protein
LLSIDPELCRRVGNHEGGDWVSSGLLSRFSKNPLNQGGL